MENGVRALLGWLSLLNKNNLLIGYSITRVVYIEVLLLGRNKKGRETRLPVKLQDLRGIS